MSRILRAYQSLLKNYPTSVHAVQTGTLMGIGDQLAQNLVERREIKHLDFARTAQFAGIGFFVAGPVLHTWYGFLHRRIGSGSSKLALKKVLVDQTFFPPPFLASLLILVSSARGNNIEEIKQKLKNNYPDILINNYKLWPMVQLVNFYFVRLEYQALVVQVVALLWNTYFSYSANRDVQPDHKSAVVQTPVKRDMES